MASRARERSSVFLARQPPLTVCYYCRRAVCWAQQHVCRSHVPEAFSCCALSPLSLRPSCRLLAAYNASFPRSPLSRTHPCDLLSTGEPPVQPLLVHLQQRPPRRTCNAPKHAFANSRHEQKRCELILLLCRHLSSQI